MLRIPATAICPGLFPTRPSLRGENEEIGGDVALIFELPSRTVEGSRVGRGNVITDGMVEVAARQ
ncbi:MAG: hypothetical protein FGM15_06725 [Chthoniobacterales bacterium]|nr:hypothetical protein [Chthoniobacterales bacterium]